MSGKATGGFYSEEAARLASEAARRPQQPAGAVVARQDPAPAYIPPVMLSEPQRPPLVHQPAINQNARLLRPLPRRPVAAEEVERRPLGVARLVGWIVLLPWYLATLAAAVGLLGLFARGMFHF